jgi:hypothetical protein
VVDNADRLRGKAWLEKGLCGGLLEINRYIWYFQLRQFWSDLAVSNPTPNT